MRTLNVNMLGALLALPLAVGIVPASALEETADGLLTGYEDAMTAEIRILGQADPLMIAYLDPSWTAALEAGEFGPVVRMRNADGALVGETPLRADVSYALTLAPGQRMVRFSPAPAEEIATRAVVDTLPAMGPGTMEYSTYVCDSSHVNCVRTRLDEGCSSCIEHHADGVTGDAHYVFACDDNGGTNCAQIWYIAASAGPYDIGWICDPHNASFWGSNAWTETRFASGSLVVKGSNLWFWVNRSC